MPRAASENAASTAPNTPKFKATVSPPTASITGRFESLPLTPFPHFNVGSKSLKLGKRKADDRPDSVPNPWTLGRAEERRRAIIHAKAQVSSGVNGLDSSVYRAPPLDAGQILDDHFDSTDWPSEDGESWSEELINRKDAEDGWGVDKKPVSLSDPDCDLGEPDDEWKANHGLVEASYAESDFAHLDDDWEAIDKPVSANAAGDDRSWLPVNNNGRVWDRRRGR